MKRLFTICLMFLCVTLTFAQLNIVKNSAKKGYETIATSDAKQKSLSISLDSETFYLIDTKPSFGQSVCDLYIPLGKTKESALQSLNDLLSLSTTLEDGASVKIGGYVTHAHTHQLIDIEIHVSAGKMFGQPYLIFQHDYNSDAHYCWDKADIKKMIKGLDKY